MAGVEPVTNDQASASRHTRTPQWGASAKAALARGHHIAMESGRGRETTTDLLLGVLQAELGTVPRALAIAGTDRTELIAHIGGCP
jgi:D-alanyl-D-alanine carboxypeptidase